MSLIEQVFSFLFSILYGVVLFFLYKYSYKYLYCNKKIYSFLNSFLFVIDNVLIYFICFYYINGGIISIYFILITILTFFINYKNYSKNLQKKCQSIVE